MLSSAGANHQQRPPWSRPTPHVTSPNAVWAVVTDYWSSSASAIPPSFCDKAVFCAPDRGLQVAHDLRLFTPSDVHNLYPLSASIQDEAQHPWTITIFSISGNLEQTRGKDSIIRSLSWDRKYDGVVWSCPRRDVLERKTPCQKAALSYTLFLLMCIPVATANQGGNLGEFLLV